MIDIVKGVLDGGWALLVGWILPALLDILLFTLVVYPSAKNSSPFSALPTTDITIFVAAVVLGVVLSALKTPLYRILEGYALWPLWLFERRRQRQIARREGLRHTVNYAGYCAAKRNLDEAETAVASATRNDDLRELETAQSNHATAVSNYERWQSAGIVAEQWLSKASTARPGRLRQQSLTAAEGTTTRDSLKRVVNYRPKHRNMLERAATLPALKRKVLAEQLERYPFDDDDILPTVLGNAIRRFEKFGPVHYGLDQQRMWYELTAAAPEAVSKQVDQMRTAVDFFVSLLFGQLMVGLAAVITIPVDPGRFRWLGGGALVALSVAVLSYRGAVATTDEWAYATQALLNMGRKPLADALSLDLPKSIATEQDMWRTVGRFLQPKPREAILTELDRYRVSAPAPKDTQDSAS